jgi:ABC-type nitrate/sulfonate/bicarbonate transport system substrate-binding protein
MEPYGADADTVEFVNIGTMDIFVAFEREIDFTWIFYGWDGIRAEVQGVELDYFPLDELDPQLDYYTPIFITREEMIEQDPEVVRSFMNAVARGYRYTAANPTEAARILRTYAPEIGEEHARRSLEYLSPFFLDEDGEWGVMQRLLWDEFTAFLDEHELLTNPLDIDAAYTNEFLPAEQ